MGKFIHALILVSCLAAEMAFASLCRSQISQVEIVSYDQIIPIRREVIATVRKTNGRKVKLKIFSNSAILVRQLSPDSVVVADSNRLHKIKFNLEQGAYEVVASFDLTDSQTDLKYSKIEVSKSGNWAVGFIYHYNHKSIREIEVHKFQLTKGHKEVRRFIEAKYIINDLDPSKIKVVDVDNYSNFRVLDISMKEVKVTPF